MTKKIRILFDANPLIRQRTGVGFYTEGVIKALAEIPELKLIGHYFAPRGPVPNLPKSPNLSFTHNSWLVGQGVKALRKIHIRLPWELLARRRGDVLFFPDFTTWPSLFYKPKLVTIHDLTFVDHPEYVSKPNLRFLRRFVPTDARRASKILTISEFSKGRIMQALNQPAAKILVDPIPAAKPTQPQKPEWLPKNFILFISTIEPRKNLSGLVEAYRLLPKNFQTKYSLVVTGGVGWKSDETIKKIRSLQEQGAKIITSGYVDNAVRAALYSSATVVAVPSFYEGFGMTVLEAFSYGAPVVASNLSVLREVSGSAALYFDPNDPQDIADILQKILSDEPLRQRQIKKAKDKAAEYSWPKVAADIYKAIRELA